MVSVSQCSAVPYPPEIFMIHDERNQFWARRVQAAIGLWIVVWSVQYAVYR